MAEFQVTQEYLGHSNHLAYLATMWKEFYRYVSPASLKGVAGVANIGDDTNWCGHDFAQANWYAYGRLAWNPSLSSEEIAKEWLAQTFTSDPKFVEPMTQVMMDSRESVVDYMMPLGLHHILPGVIITDRNLGVRYRVLVQIGCRHIIIRQTKKVWDLTGAVLEVMRCLSIQTL